MTNQSKADQRGQGPKRRVGGVLGLAAIGAALALMALGCDGAPGETVPPGSVSTAPAGSTTAPSAASENPSASGSDSGCSSGVAALAAPLAVAPATLSATGLYCTTAQHVLNAGVRAFHPRNALWSDGAEKSRWIALPAGSHIDATDLDHWSFPVGTRAWKEFKYLGRRVETRFIARTGAGPNDFLFASYLWNASETEATLVAPEGKREVSALLADGTGPKHDVPAIAACKSCHNRLPERFLGLGAIQSSHDGEGVTLASLIDDGLIAPVPPVRAFAIPGDEIAQAALGYLHANCSHCHNDTPSGVTFPRYAVRLHVGDTTVADTDVFRTAVNVLHTWLGAPEGVGAYRIAGGNPEGSELYYRTGVRTPSEQMPPLGTELVDEAGHEVLRKWIVSLPAQTNKEGAPL